MSSSSSRSLHDAIDAIDRDDTSPRRPTHHHHHHHGPPPKPPQTKSKTRRVPLDVRVAALLGDDFRGDLHTRAQAHAALQRRPVGTFLVRPSETAPAGESSLCLVVSHVDRVHGIGHMLIYAHHAPDAPEPVFSNHASPGAGSSYSNVRDVLARYHFPDACRCGWKASAPTAAVISPIASPRTDEPIEAGIFYRADFRRTDAETWLASQPPGTYVVRPSKERPDAFTVSLRERPGGLLMHAGLARAPNGTWTLDGSPAVHASLRQLLLSMPQNLIVAAPLGAAVAVDASPLPAKPPSATKPRNLVRGATSQQLDTQLPPERPLARAVSSSNLQPPQAVLRSRPLPNLDDDAPPAAAPTLEPTEPSGGYTRPDASRTAAWRGPPATQNQYQSLELAPLPYTVLRPET